MKDRIVIPSYLGHCLLQVVKSNKNVHLSVRLKCSWLRLLMLHPSFSISACIWSMFFFVVAPPFDILQVACLRHESPQALCSSHFSLRCSLHSTSGSGKGLTLRQYPSISHQINAPEQTLQCWMVVDGGGAMGIKGREVY